MTRARRAEGTAFSLGPPPARLLVYRPGALGDFLLVLPALAALRASFPGAQLTVVGHAAALELARAEGLADAVLGADAPALTPLFAASPPREAPFPLPDTAVLWAGAAAGPLAANLRALGSARVLHVPSQPPPERPRHVADYLVESLAPLDVVARGPALPRLTASPTALADASAFLAREGSAAQRWVAFHPGSGSPRKNWPVAHFGAVAHGLAGYGLRPVLVAGPAEAETLEAARQALLPLRPALARDWPLPRLAALLRLCVGYVGLDSGVSHLAAAAGARVVAIFGPTDPHRWAPRGPRVAIVRRAVTDRLTAEPTTPPAAPASAPTGPPVAPAASLSTLPPDAVLAAAVRCFELDAETPAAGKERARTRKSVLYAPTLPAGGSVTSCSNPR
jgi:heptosyltransferase III